MRAMGFGVGVAKNVIIDVARDIGGYMAHIKPEKVPAGSTSEVAFGEERKESRASCGQFLCAGIGELASIVPATALGPLGLDGVSRNCESILLPALRIVSMSPYGFVRTLLRDVPTRMLHELLLINQACKTCDQYERFA